MGKIFGISDLPVSTIMTPFEPIQVPNFKQVEVVKSGKIFKKETDSFVSKNVIKSNPIIKMRNGIGKLMKHFSKKIVR